jgi:hypothetical protein
MSHAHEHPHDHAHRPEPANQRAGQGPPVLDIGGDIGALVLYTPDDLIGREIDISPVAEPDRRTHTEVLARTIGGQTISVAVYMALREGRYHLWDDAPGRANELTIRGGEVTELDWRP